MSSNDFIDEAIYDLQQEFSSNKSLENTVILTASDTTSTSCSRNSVASGTREQIGTIGIATTSTTVITDDNSSSTIQNKSNVFSSKLHLIRKRFYEVI